MHLRLAVVGKDVSKSASPRMHTFILNKLGATCDYERVSIPEAEFDSAAERLFCDYDAFNVTIPYKLSIMRYLNAVNGDAHSFGAVNTVTAEDRAGYNTDGPGFLLMLKNNGVSISGKRFLVLGAGGAGRSVVKKLLDEGASVSVYDRNSESAKLVAAEFAGAVALDEVKTKPYDAIVNATGVGMHKTEGVSPVSGALLSLCDCAIDLIYAPKQSEFLRLAASFGKKTVNGEAMLFYQAYFADCIYLGKAPNDAFAKQIFNEYLRLTEKGEI